jgi:SAM-dependent methyltransferase
MTETPWRLEWDAQAADWVTLTNDDPFYDDYNKPAFLELVPSPGELTLDVGCGEGRVARELTARGHRVVGIDGSPLLVAAAANGAPPTPAAVADISGLPVATGVADLVVCFMVLMDVEDLVRSVSELARVLAPGGTLCVGILHPINTSGLFVPEDPNRTFYMGEYMKPMRHVLDIPRPSGETFRFRVAHRSLSEFLAAFEAAGLAITALREPRPTDEMVAVNPGFANYQRVPNFLHLRAVHERDGSATP